MTIWHIRNEVIFGRCQHKTFLEVTFKGTRWLCHWAQLVGQCEGNMEHIIHVCQALEVTTLEFFASFGWAFLI
ncbi:hypothetical protein SORBI_3009G072550 [Sorghum bicolor]|uniref:Uncharacterized protein n=1 Tax=Sorghum bicolor TaxID=4558 RepID=A0A1Z5R1D3_SORBI|nr:hypothetical protein SORBI_3009G072550 [Sorghum bicolor]